MFDVYMENDWYKMQFLFKNYKILIFLLLQVTHIYFLNY